MSQNLGSLLCQQDFDKLRPAQLWQQGVFDTDIMHHEIEARPGQWLSRSRLEHAAQTYARRFQHHGYAFVLCSETKAWIITTPSPHPIASVTEEGARLDLTGPLQKCRAMSLDHASSNSAAVRRLLQKTMRDVELAGSRLMHLNPQFLDEGFISLSCFPNNTNLGPAVWAMLPSRMGIDTSLNHSPSSLTARDIVNWINRARIDETQNPLAASEAKLHQAASALSQQNSTVMHHRPQLRQLRESLEADHWQVLGENRVRVRNSQQLAWLLWSSPRHRSLLLNPHATYIGISSRRLANGEYLVVMLMAHPSNQPGEGATKPVARGQEIPQKTL